MPLGKNADAGDYIKDFEKSKAPQFKGKSKEKRRKMAIAAYLDSKDKKESKMKSFDDIRAELDEAKFKVEIDGGIETVDARSEKEAIRKAARKQGNSKSVGKSFGPKVKVTKISEEDQVQEISSNKLGDYMRKSAQSAAKPGQSARTQDKRIAGQSMADKKIRKKMGYSSTAKVPAGKNESVDEGFTKKSVETGKVKTGASKGRMAAMQKQDDNRPTLRKNEAKQTHMFDNEKDARAKAKEIGGKYVKGTGKSAGKHAAIKEGIVGSIGKGIKKVASPVTNRLTRSGRAAIAQKKIDKHNTKVQQKDTIKKANDAGKSAFGFTQKQRAANAKKKLDKLAKKKAQQDTINRAKNLKKGVTAGMEYEGKKMDSAAMKKAMDVFKKRGGKITKVAPGKAAGYHGKDDPGKDMRGMMDKGDTKNMPKKKFMRSMK